MVQHKKSVEVHASILFFASVRFVADHPTNRLAIFARFVQCQELAMTSICDEVPDTFCSDFSQPGIIDLGEDGAGKL